MISYEVAHHLTQLFSFSLELSLGWLLFRLKRLWKFFRRCLLTAEDAFFGFLSLTGRYAFFGLRLVRVSGTSKLTLGTLFRWYQ